MAVPLLAPLVMLIPLIKILALGSIKFVGIGLGAAIAPVMTANFLVGLSSSTPLKYSKFRFKRGQFTKEQMDIVERANQLITASINNEDEHLTKAEAREFLKEMLVGTAISMKEGFLSIPTLCVRFCKETVGLITKLFPSGGK